MRYLTFIIACCSLYITSCNGSAENKQETTQVAAPAEPPKSKLNDEGTTKLMDVVTSYYALKDALVATNAAQADDAANKLVASTENMQSFLQTDSINGAGLQPYLDTIKTQSRQITGVKDETTEQKRVYFEKVSDAIYALLQSADLKNGAVYRQYCPMAFNDKGAYWLSNETEIRNPYFGKKMLECGEVTDSL